MNRNLHITTKSFDLAASLRWTLFGIAAIIISLRSDFVPPSTERVTSSYERDAQQNDATP
jgi:hypothetical protein